MDDSAVPTSASSPVVLDDRQIAERLVYLGFVQQDADVLLSLRPWAQRVVGDFLEQFYDHQFSHREFVELMEAAGTSRARLVETQRRYVLDLFQGMPDSNYVQSRQRIGQVHARLKVTPRWYVSSYELYEHYLFPMLRRHLWLRPIKRRRAVAALSRLLNFDKSIVLDQYALDVAEGAARYLPDPPQFS